MSCIAPKWATQPIHEVVFDHNGDPSTYRTIPPNFKSTNNVAVVLGSSGNLALVNEGNLTLSGAILNDSTTLHRDNLSQFRLQILEAVRLKLTMGHKVALSNVKY